MATFTIGSRTRTTQATATQTNNNINEEETDDEKKPSHEVDAFWIFEYPRDSNLNGGGKWMLFYPNTLIDSAWSKAKRLFRSGSLTGISCMKVSTARGNPRSSSNNSKVIICYCGPPHDETNVLKYGRNLVNMMQYRNSNPYVYYKSDQQTVQGTRATGQTKNHLYKITIPRTVDGEKPSSDEKSGQRGEKRKLEISKDVEVMKEGSIGGSFSGTGSCSGGGKSSEKVPAGREAFLRKIENDISKNKRLKSDVLGAKKCETDDTVCGDFKSNILGESLLTAEEEFRQMFDV